MQIMYLDTGIEGKALYQNHLKSGARCQIPTPYYMFFHPIIICVSIVAKKSSWQRPARQRREGSGCQATTLLHRNLLSDYV